MSSAPIPTDGHRSKAAAAVYANLHQAGPMHDLAFTCLLQANGRYRQAAQRFMRALGDRTHAAQGAAYSTTNVSLAMALIWPNIQPTHDEAPDESLVA